jgi:hypothetical protein
VSPRTEKNGELLLKAGELWAACGTDAARNILTELVEKEFGPAYVVLGDLLVSEYKQYQTAYALYHEEFLKSEDIEARIGVARMLFYGLGVTLDHEQVLKLCDDVACEKHPLIEQLAGRVLWQAKNNDAALERLTNSYRLGNWYTLKYLGWCQIDNGQRLKGWITLCKGFVLTSFAEITRLENRIRLV